MEIRGFIETSLLDFEGKVASVLFVGGCNFRCPYCQNAGLVLNPERYEPIPQERIDHYLKTHRDFIDGICISGGEPCLYGEDLMRILRHFKDMGFLTKLDTNGSRPGLIEDIIREDIVDYIAMDIKAPLDFESYSRSTGIGSRELLEAVLESIRIIMASGVDYEFRTTVVPTLHTGSDIERIASFINGAKRFILQNFQAVKTLDPAYGRVVPYPMSVLEEMQEISRNYVKESRVRGR